MNNWDFLSRWILSPPASAWEGFLWNSMNLRSWWIGSWGGKCPHYFFTSERKTVAPIKQYWSVAQSCLTVCNPVDYSMPGFPLLHRLPRVCSNSCLLSRWCHPTISSSVASFSCPQSFPASGSFPLSLLFASGAKVLELQRQYFQGIFRLIKQGGRANKAEGGFRTTKQKK